MANDFNTQTEFDDAQTKVDTNDPLPATGAFPFNIDQRFEYCRELGRGGCSTVCLAYDHILQRQVALKFILGESARNTATVLQEARTQANVKHQHICQIYEVCEFEHHVYLVMQYVKGGTLSGFAAKLNLEQKLLVIEKVLRGLHQAHTLGIIHRDIKPANILIEHTDDGDFKPYLIDFGIAQTEQALGGGGTSNRYGTPHYMAPELLLTNAWQVDRRADIYGIGVTLFQLIFDQFPKRPEMMADVATAKVTDYLSVSLSDQALALPEDLQLLLCKCLAIKPTQRYSSAKALADELRRYIEGEPLKSFAGFGYKFKKKVKKNKLLVTLMTTVLFTLVTSAVSLLWQDYRQEKREQMLQQFTAKVENMEARVRFTHMAPRHDISVEITQWQDEIGTLERQIESLGELAFGPGHYAIGRMYYALQQYDQALSHLQLAWSAGFVEPRAAYVLAMVHGAIYQRRKSQIDNLPSGIAKEAKLTLLDEKYRQPAIQLLEQGMESTPHQVLAKATLLLYQQAPQKALTLLNTVEHFPSWFYQNFIIKGDIYQELAKRAVATHNHNEVTLFTNQALKYYRQAIAIAPSDFQLQLNPVRLYMNRLNTVLYGGQGDFEQQYAQALQYLEQGALVNSQHYRTHFLKGQLLAVKSEYEEQHSGTPVKTINRAIEQILTASRKAPEKSAVWLALAMAYSAQYKLVQSRGDDGAVPLAKAIEAFEHIGESDHDYRYYSTFGGLLRAQALLLTSDNDKSNEAYFERAVEAYQQASVLQPGAIGALINAGSVLRLWSAGLSVTQAKHKLSQAIDKYQQARQLNQDHFVATYYLGLSYRALARLANQLFEDNQPLLALAEQHLQQALILGKQHPFVVNELAILENDQAVYAWQQGLPYQPMLTQAIARLDESLTINPSNHVLITTRVASYLGWRELNYLSGKEDKALNKQAIELTQQHSTLNRQDKLMVALFEGVDISAKEIAEVEENSDGHLLLLALWHSNEHRFAKAEVSFANIKQFYPAVLWLYRYQHLQRWQRNTTDAAQILWLADELTTLSHAMNKHYPALGILP
ncbi:MAG: protein kinase [Algicola sp.]|nr:protein kinase [Algicola sp.]